MHKKFMLRLEPVRLFLGVVLVTMVGCSDEQPDRKSTKFEDVHDSSTGATMPIDSFDVNADTPLRYVIDQD